MSKRDMEQTVFLVFFAVHISARVSSMQLGSLGGFAGHTLRQTSHGIRNNQQQQQRTHSGFPSQVNFIHHLPTAYVRNTVHSPGAYAGQSYGTGYTSSVNNGRRVQAPSIGSFAGQLGKQPVQTIIRYVMPSNFYRRSAHSIKPIIRTRNNYAQYHSPAFNAYLGQRAASRQNIQYGGTGTRQSQGQVNVWNSFPFGKTANMNSYAQPVTPVSNAGLPVRNAYLGRRVIGKEGIQYRGSTQNTAQIITPFIHSFIRRGFTGIENNQHGNSKQGQGRSRMVAPTMVGYGGVAGPSKESENPYMITTGMNSNSFDVKLDQCPPVGGGYCQYSAAGHYSHPSDPHCFIQCNEFGKAFVKSCPYGTRWAASGDKPALANMCTTNA